MFNKIGSPAMFLFVCFLDVLDVFSFLRFTIIVSDVLLLYLIV